MLNNKYVLCIMLQKCSDSKKVFFHVCPVFIVLGILHMLFIWYIQHHISVLILYTHDASLVNIQLSSQKSAAYPAIFGSSAGPWTPNLPFLLYTPYTAAGEFSSPQILSVMCALAGPRPVVVVGCSCILIYFKEITRYFPLGSHNQPHVRPHAPERMGAARTSLTAHHYTRNWSERLDSNQRPPAPKGAP